MSTVLVVERDPAVATVIRQLLEDAGHTVLACKESGSCFGVVSRGDVELVVLELLTPTPSRAREAMSALRHDQRTADIPILVCTVDERQVREWSDWLHQQRIHVLLKPFDIDAFIETVDAVLEEHRSSIARAY